MIPGSHRHDHPVRTSPGGLDAMLEETGLKPEENPFALPIPTKLGDCIIFNHDCFHASFGGGVTGTYHSNSNEIHGLLSKNLNWLFDACRYSAQDVYVELHEACEATS